jgi:hypothetical protein
MRTLRKTGWVAIAHGPVARALSALALSWTLGACSIVLAVPPTISERVSDKFTPAHLVYCYGHSCARQQTVSFRPADWESVRAVFATAPNDAKDEQARIKVAIGLMEKFAGAQAGTSKDRGGTIEFGYDTGDPQLDCYDDAINVTNFLGLLERDGLLRYHRVESPVQRSFVNGDIIHATGVVRDITSGRRYAVDSSYFDNGKPASIVSLDAWLDGWSPPELNAVAIN